MLYCGQSEEVTSLLHPYICQDLGGYILVAESTTAGNNSLLRIEMQLRTYSRLHSLQV